MEKITKKKLVEGGLAKRMDNILEILDKEITVLRSKQSEHRSEIQRIEREIAYRNNNKQDIIDSIKILRGEIE